MRKSTNKARYKTAVKVFLIALPIVAVLVIGGVVLAVIGITTPTNLTYEAQTATTMQTFTSDNCTSMQTYTTVTLTDDRDGTGYRVRKMPDGQCWMIDNLKLAGGTTLNASNTNLNNTSDSAFISAWAALSTQSTAISTTAPTWVDPADSTRNTSYYTNCQPGAPGISPDSLTGCGYLYNWYAATAGTGTAAMTTGDATSSICPVGWHLPSAGSGIATATNEFAVLHGAMEGSSTPSTTSTATSRNNWLSTGPFEGAYAGYWLGSFNSQGYNGYYWSASASSAATARVLYFAYNTVAPGSSALAKSYGHSVRCVL